MLILEQAIYVNLNFLSAERGDYQTPSDFANEICNYILLNRNIKPKMLLEPTFGLGNFIEQAIQNFDSIAKVYGIEILREYFDIAKERFKTRSNNIALYNNDIFNFDFELIKKKLNKKEKLLILGNPPWVTNSELESINSSNLPIKENIKKLKGMDALTGKSNFDIAEYIILKLIENFQGYNCTIAMLCKNIVAKNIVRDVKDFGYNINNIEMINFDAKQVFNVSCDASLFMFDIGNTKEYLCNVYDIKKDRKVIRSFGWDLSKNTFISDLQEYAINSTIDGKSQIEWRQGVKHDCSKIMQLSIENNHYINGNKELIELENEYVYPLLKSSDIKKNIIKDTRKYVIVTQRKTGEDTSCIEKKAPLLWKYLIQSSKFLDARKSSIYKNSPRFSIFGIGEYSFKSYKVCISGFYKEPKVSLAFREDKKPIMLDDTCYFLGFDNYKNALITTILLNSKRVSTFLKSIAFLDSKRPYTKDILMRIDLLKIYNITDYNEFCSLKKMQEINENISNEEYSAFALFLKNFMD